ncbi:hypothetical protein J437_LFUL005253 [Ladona fulva]|uniref:Uncharacterized protein n=1 Tax=Ladona fulva TaxID=123851 RepID=A0A8K0JXA4_LADFU|nr:hypothetical protein J437_LFUL005253 [Ladona fulva]
MAIGNSSNDLHIRMCLGIIEKTYAFFDTPKRMNILTQKNKRIEATNKVKDYGGEIILSRISKLQKIRVIFLVNREVEMLPKEILDELMNRKRAEDYI